MKSSRDVVHFFLVLMMLCLSSTSQAKTPLQTIQDTYGFKATKQGDFVQTKTLSGLPFSLKSNGQYAISDEGQLSWEILAPVQSTLIINDQEIRQLDQGEETMRISVSEQPMLGIISQSFLAMFSGQWGELEDHFDHSLETTADGWRLTLKPKSAVLQQFSQFIALEGAQHLQSFELQETNGDKTEIEFTVTNNVVELKVEPKNEAQLKDGATASAKSIEASR